MRSSIKLIEWNLKISWFSEETLDFVQNLCTLQQSCLSCSEDHWRVMANNWLWITSHSLASVVLDMVQPILELGTKEYTWYAINGIANVLLVNSLAREVGFPFAFSQNNVQYAGNLLLHEGKSPTICHGIQETSAGCLWRTFSLRWLSAYGMNTPRRKTKQKTTADHYLLQVKFPCLYWFACDNLKWHFRWLEMKNGQYSTKLAKNVW